MSKWKIAGLVLLILGVGGAAFGWYVYHYAELDPYVPMFAENCADCHGADLMGTDKGIALIDAYLEGGDTVAGLIQSIRNGNPASGMPAFEGVLDNEQIKGLSIYIAERRLGQRFVDFRFETAVVIPEAAINSEAHGFVIETFADDLDPLPFSIEPLPDGSFLLTEKERGLSIISADGKKSPPIEGTPRMGGSENIRGVHYGVGWLLGVATHPDYATNGWVYLHYTDICGSCEGLGSSTGLFPSSMNRLDRGRIRDGKWVDVETIWQTGTEHYSQAPDTGAGGRVAFDDSGHVFISVGIKGLYGPQDLNSPYGKIHRINDDGSIPPDNPFVISANQTSGEVPFSRQTVWTYGHRSPQGLEWNTLRRSMWNSEMGPRGGDEINELLPGRNYGWPYHSLGLEYTGARVERHKTKDIEFNLDEVEQTLVDITPSPAISSFVFYHGSQFANWQDNVLIGSLKGSSLFRMVFDGNRLVHQETLIKDLARIRDIEVGYDGLVYLLLENEAGGKIVRLRPVDE